MDRRIYQSLAICASVLLFSCTQEPAGIVRHPTNSAGNPKSAANNPYKVIIQKGDTLYSIAKKNNVEVRAVMDINDMRPPYTLISGQSLSLPKPQFHVVNDTDNLYAISRVYNVDIGRLAQKNNLTSPYSLSKGQKLYLPSPTATDNDSNNKVIATAPYDYGTKSSASRGVASSDLPPISDPVKVSSAGNSSASAVSKSNGKTKITTDNSSPFATSAAENNSASHVSQSGKAENLDNKIVQPFSYKSEGEFGGASSDGSVKKENLAPIAAIKNSGSSSGSAVVSAPLPVLGGNSSSGDSSVDKITSSQKKSDTPVKTYPSLTENRESNAVVSKKSQLASNEPSDEAPFKTQTQNAPDISPQTTDTASMNTSAPTPISSAPIASMTADKNIAPISENGKPIAPVISKKISKNESFVWPASGKIISGFGPKNGGLYNDGINIAAKSGTPIKASDSGEVVYSGSELKGYGNMLLIKHNNGYLTAYAHASDRAVKKGDMVKRGEVIGHVGQTGHVSSPQLHFSIRQGRKAIDPEKHLPANM